MSSVDRRRAAVPLAALMTAILFGAGPGPLAQPAPGSRYEDLTSLFASWRAFQQPALVDGVPDYSAAAMAAQQRALPAYQQRLTAIDGRSWPLPQQIDWHVVRAEMAGLEFDHRVLRPWEKNPAFYVSFYPSRSDQPAREGPVAFGAIELWAYTFPLSDEAAARLDAALRTIPPFLRQARVNLTGNARDLWIYGTRSLKQQSADLKALTARVAGGARFADLQRDAEQARDATDGLVAWLEAEAPKKTGPSGIGVEAYDWYLKHVQLAPYTWREEKALMERELARAVAMLAMEEQRNAELPPQTVTASAAEYDARFAAGVTDYMAFLASHGMMTVRPEMEPALRARKGRFRSGPRDFFDEITYRDAEVMRTHDYHWFDLARMAGDPHPDPIRRGPLLYNIFVTRTEGHATGWEELSMQAGMLDAKPRSRELVYVLLGERAARALGDLRMHANELTLEESARFVSASTPRGWLSIDGRTVWEEQHLYLQQPGYGTSYLTGKMQIDALLAARRRQLGDRFVMKTFMDDFNAAGLVPASLLRWELTGELPGDVAAMLDIRDAGAQRQVAAPVTDPADPKFLTEQTRKMGGPMPPEQLALVFDHLDLAMKVFPDQHRVEATATLRLKTRARIDTLILDLFPKFTIAEIDIDGRRISSSTYANPEGQLRIALAAPFEAGRTFEARVVYAGTPPLAKRPPWEGGTTWTKTPDGKSPWIDTSLWGGGCDLLYPCLDHPTLKPATSDLHYTVPAGLMAPGSGALVGKEDKDGWTTWNWHARSIHTYGSVLDVGPYKVMEGDYKSRFGNTIPMRFYYLPGEEKQAAELFAEFPQTLGFWENVIGPYPWADQKMGVVRVPYSGLENQTMIGYSDNYPKTTFGWDWLLNHEFSHEWFANQLSVANYDDLWLHEGLGSYAQPLLAEYLGGEIDYMAQLKTQRAGIRNEQPLVTGRERPEKEVYADPTGPRGDIYPKGSWVAHTLRQLIGDEAFFKAIRTLVYGRPDPKPGNFTPQFGTTQGFLNIVNEVTGKDYKWFFDVYFYRAALPKVMATRENGLLKLRWQTPDNLPFPMPLDVRVDGKIVTLPMTGGRGETAAGDRAAVTIDPRSKILMQSDAIDKYQEWNAARAAKGGL